MLASEDDKTPKEPNKGAQNTVMELDDASALFSGSSIEDTEKQADGRVRRGITTASTLTFLGLNVAVVAIVCGLAYLDYNELAAGLIKPADRIVTTGVVESLIWATVVELGLIVATTSAAMFKVKPLRHLRENIQPPS